MTTVTTHPPEGTNGPGVVQRDHRGPVFRLTQLFDPGSIEPIHTADDSGGARSYRP
jgi:hypothetical protein